MKEKLIREICDDKLVVIIRGVEDSKLEPLFEAMYEGGVRFAEITFDAKGIVTPKQTAEKISRMKERFEGKIHVGAGTVIRMEQAREAVAAGAEFLISPNTNLEIIDYAAKEDIISMPGAMTPTEAVTAYDRGADFVKIFPSDSLGVGYIKALCAPLSHIPFMAVGGVNHLNVADFLKAGVCGVGVGSNIVNKEMLKNESWAEITELAHKYRAAIDAYMQKG